MKRYKVSKIAVPKYPVLRLTFDDGWTGDLDLSGTIGRGPLFKPLADEMFFRQVSIAGDGCSFGWRLDQTGSEIDFGADAARADIETAMVEARAAHYRSKLSHAAE